MHDITKHYTKEEWERDNGGHSWVELLVVRSTIGVYNLLEDSHELIFLE